MPKEEEKGEENEEKERRRIIPLVLDRQRRPH
jgi:hypothetical protein